MTLHRITQRLLLGLAFVFAFVLLWRKIRIVIFVHMSFGQLLLLFLGLALAIYLILEAVLGRREER